MGFNDFNQLVYGFSTKDDGNMSPLRGDAEITRENRITFLEKLDIRPERTVKCRLSHSTHIHIVSPADLGAGILAHTHPLPDTDGLITNRKNVYLFMVTADCIPVLFYDPQKSVIGLLHAGWRGTVDNIVSKGIQIATTQFNSNPADINVLLGPGICGACYEVGEDVRSRFVDAFPVDFSKFIRPNGNTYQLDLYKANGLQLLHEGIRKENMEIVDSCTKCNVQTYYSARAEGIETGRFASVIGIRGL